MKNSEVSAYIACAIEAALLVVNTDTHRGTRRRAATTLLHAIQVRTLNIVSLHFTSRARVVEGHATQSSCQIPPHHLIHSRCLLSNAASFLFIFIYP
jgi:NO-binding membrane sensor protein with MHYT domain